MIKITLPDGKELAVEKNITAYDVVGEISKGLQQVALIAEIDGVKVDLNTQIKRDCTFKVYTFDDEEGKNVYWHSSAHLMAQAVKHLFPSVKVAIGPAIHNGFYYDFDIDHPFSPEDIEKIEKEMQKLAAEKIELTRSVLSKADALDKFNKEDEIYKVDLIENFDDETVSLYSQGDFTDLCRGPHLPHTGYIKAIKILSNAGAYWRGDEHNKMLQRLYAISFPDKKALKKYLLQLEEAKKRDHRKLGKELGLFALLEEGPGFPFFLPNGMVVKNKLVDYWRELHTRAGYVEISTPMMMNRNLWERSGHWDHYKENMYTTVIDETDFAIKPMNCPGGMLVYKTEPRSYRDLPMRVGELGLVHRHEKSGTLHGLMRVRCFTQDDAHIFMTEEMIKDEIIGVVKLIDEVYTMFGFKYHVELSTMPEDHMGDEKKWDNATKSLIAAMEELGREYKVNEGDGAFYGPKLDFHLEDSLGRTWQCGTIQLDFQLPERFELNYIGADGEKHQPVMIHRVVFGSIERFIGILIEHYAGAFPVWLAPVQVKLLNVSDAQADYVKTVEAEMKKKGLRVETDLREETVGYKIREAVTHKIPYVIVLGDKEKEANTLSIRKRGEKQSVTMNLNDFLLEVSEKIENKL